MAHRLDRRRGPSPSNRPIRRHHRHLSLRGLEQTLLANPLASSRRLPCSERAPPETQPQLAPLMPKVPESGLAGIGQGFGQSPLTQVDPNNLLMAAATMSDQGRFSQ